MLVKVDARGLACPKPVISVKKELDKLKDGIVKVTVDNKIAKENIFKLAGSLNCEPQIIKEEDGFIEINIIKGEEVLIEQKNNVDLEDKCIFISSDKMGNGEDELGEVLMKGFIYALTEAKPYPKHIIFVNSAVKLTTQNQATVENLIILENDGVEIISCGTCLDYYNVKESLKVGTITNMYNIVDIMKNALQTISI